MGCRGSELALSTNLAWSKARGRGGFCYSHYSRKKRHGTPLGGRTPPLASLEWLREQVSNESVECLIWPFGCNDKGYGEVHYAGAQRLAHRVMCTMVHGPAPSPDHDAAHSCGNGAGGCVNGLHLRWATKKENAADKISHGTHGRGANNSMAKLTEEAVHIIRELLSANSLHQDVADLFGISRTVVTRIANGTRWGSLLHRGR